MNKFEWKNTETLPEWGITVLIACTRTFNGETKHEIRVGSVTESGELLPYWNIPEGFKVVYWSYIPEPNGKWEDRLC